MKNEGVYMYFYINFGDFSKNTPKVTLFQHPINFLTNKIDSGDPKMGYMWGFGVKIKTVKKVYFW